MTIHLSLGVFTTAGLGDGLRTSRLGQLSLFAQPHRTKIPIQLAILL